MARSFSDLISDISIAEQGSTGSRSFYDLLSALESQSAPARQFSPSFDFVGPVRPGEEYSPEFMGPIAPPSPRDALQRQVDATIAARETSQRYATLPKRVADVYNVYKNEDLAREALDLADQLKIEYPEYGEDIEDLLMKGLRPEDIRTQITQKRERKRRQSELATQYPDFAKDVDKLFGEGFSPEEVTSRMEAMAGAKARIEQRKQEEIDRKSAETYAKEIEAQQARTRKILSTAGIEAGPSASRVGELTRQIEVGRAAGQDISDLERERRLIQAYGIQGLPTVARISELRRRLATTPESERADIQFLINSLQRGLGGATTEQVATAQPTPGEALAQQLYGEARGAVTGATLGAARPLFERAEKATGGLVPRQGIGETAAEAIGGLATGVIGAGALAPSVRGLYAGLGGVGAQAATRGTIGGIQSGAQTAIALAQGADISPADAAVNIGQGILSSALSVPIAARVPGVKLNAAAQVAGDFVVDLAADVAYRDRLKDQSFVDWLLKEELPNLAVSIAGAGKDVLDARVAKTEIRRLFDQRMRSGEATPPAPTRAEAPAPELVTRPADVPEQTPEQRQYVLDQVLMEEAGRANIADYERMMEGSRQAEARQAEEARKFEETLKAREAAKQADEIIRRREAARAEKPAEQEVTGEGPVTGVMPEDKYIGKQIMAGMIGEREIGALYGRRDQLMQQLEREKAGPEYDLIQSRINELNRIIDENKTGATTDYSSPEDLRSKLEQKISGARSYTNKRLALEDDARYHGVQFAGRTPEQIISDITKKVEADRITAAEVVDITDRPEEAIKTAEAEVPPLRSAAEIAAERGQAALRREEPVGEVRPVPETKPESAKLPDYGRTIEQLDINALREDIKILGYKGGRDRLVAVAEQFGIPTDGTPKQVLQRIEEAYNAAKERQIEEGGLGEYRGDGARVQEEGQDRIITPFIEKGRPEAGGGYRPAPGGNVPPGPVGRGVQGQQAVTPAAGGAVPLTTPPPAAGGAAGAAGAPAPLPGGQKRFGFIGPTKQKKSVEIDESISPNVRAVDDALERQQRDLERLSMGKGRKSFDSIAEGLWDSQSLAKRKLIASELKDAESRLILRKGWAANAKDQYDERISAIDKLITHGNEKSFSEYLEMRRLVEVADLKNAKGEDYDLPYGITPEQAKEWISTFENQKSADGTLNTYKAAADEYYKAARQQLDEMRAEGLLTKEGYASLVQNHKNYSPQQMIDKLDPENSSGLAKPGAGAPIKALKGGSESGRVIDYRYLLARTIAAAQNRIFTNRANKELVSGVQKGGEKVAKEIGAIIDDGSFDKIPAGYERIKSFDDGIEKSIFVPKEFAKSWNESDPGLNKATAEFLRTWSGSRVVKAMATGYNPEFILSNFPRDAAYAWFRTGEYSPILPIGAVQQVKDYVDTAKDAFRKSGIYKDYLKEGGGLDGLSAEGRLDKNPWDKVTPTTQTAKDLARWASFLGEFSERWTRLAVYNRAIKNGKSKMEAAKIARDMLDFSQGGKLVKGVDTVVPYLNAMTQGTRGLANSFTENGLGKQSFKAAQVMAIAAGLGSVAREYFNEQWNAISDQEKASKWIIPLPGSYKDDEGKTRYRYLAIPKDQGQAVFAAMSDAMVGAMRGEKPDAKALLFALKQAVPDVTAGSPIGNAALAYFNNLDTFRMEEVYRGRPTTPSAEFSGNAAFDESMRKLSEISGGAIEISPARLKRATEKVILPHNPFTIMTGLAANQLLPEELRAEANEFAIENQPFIRRFMRSTQPIEVPASVAEKAERLGLEMGDKPGKQVRREVYQAERELGAKRNVQDKEIRKIMSGIKSGRTSYRDLLRYIDETPEEDRNRIRRRMNDIQEEYGLEFDFSGSDIGLPKPSELRGGLKTIK